MKIGYACINLSLACRSSRTFRLKSYSAGNMERTVGSNLSCLREQLRYNLEHGIYYFRISSDLVPFVRSLAMWSLLSSAMTSLLI